MIAGGGELAEINRYTLRPLAAEEVFVFSVVLCDNEIDRDGERFSIPALEVVAGLFLGKSGIFDHNPKAEHQTARIFRCEVIQDAARTTQAGETYHALKARAYMLRSEKNASLIAEIEAGIKKEVSVGCAVKEVRCSVCGQNLLQGPCAHKPGEAVNGGVCHRILDKPTDAYEWSFVAVPAQPGAGVSKAYRMEEGEMGMEEVFKKLGNSALTAEEGQAVKAHLLTLEKAAAYGRAYKEGLEKEVLRLAFAARPEADCTVLKTAVERMEVNELAEFKKLFEADGQNFLACEPQLARPKAAAKPENTEFKI